MVKNDFVERLSVYIEARSDLTPSRLAIDAGLDNSAIRALLSGKARHPRLDTALAICAALGTTLERFMSADVADLREGRIPRSRASAPLDPIDRRILDLIETLEPDERLRLLGYAEALTADHARPDPASRDHARADRGDPEGEGARQAPKIPATEGPS